MPLYQHIMGQSDSGNGDAGLESLCVCVCVCVCVRTYVFNKVH